MSPYQYPTTPEEENHRLKHALEFPEGCFENMLITLFTFFHPVARYQLYPIILSLMAEELLVYTYSSHS